MPIVIPSISTEIFGSNDLSDSFELIPLREIADPRPLVPKPVLITTLGAKPLKSATVLIVESFKCHHFEETNSNRKRRSITDFSDECSCKRSQITQIFNEQGCFEEL